MGQIDRENFRIVVFKDFLLFIFFHDVCVADIECLQIFAVTFCIAVHIVAAEEFIRTFSGIADLCVFCGRIAGNGKYDRGGIAKRLLHVVHNIRYDIKILLWCDLADRMFSSEKFCCLFGKA